LVHDRDDANATAGNRRGSVTEGAPGQRIRIASDLELGEQEVALVLSLELDTTSVPNPTSGKATTREGPVS
jgi:hypothetical protein